MNRLSPLNRILVRLIGILLAVSLFLGILRFNSTFQDYGNSAYGFISSMRVTLFDDPIQSISDFVSDLSSLYALKAENDRLRQQIDLLEQFQARLEEAYRDIEDLKTLNDLKMAMTDYHLIAALVLNRPSDTFDHIITLNIGSADGVEVDDAVISSTGLIGKVKDVSDKTCRVLLLTTEQELNKVSVKIQVSSVLTAEALLEYYDVNSGSYVLSLLQNDSSITEGMTVISSGLGATYPSGLLVGKVSKVETQQNSGGVTLYVTPAADFSHLNYVAVVKRGVTDVD
jgi:rod shape-determining protein MreC